MPGRASGQGLLTSFSKERRMFFSSGDVVGYFSGMTATNNVRFKAKLVRYPGKGGWHFVQVPKKYAPPVTHGWGRTPVHATVDGKECRTSVWRTEDGKTFLPVAAKVRGEKGHGDSVLITLRFIAL